MIIQKDTLQAFAAPRVNEPVIEREQKCGGLVVIGGEIQRLPGFSPLQLSPFPSSLPQLNQLQWVKVPETEGRMMPFGGGFDPNQDILGGEQSRRTFNV